MTTQRFKAAVAKADILAALDSEPARASMASGHRHVLGCGIRKG
jgi:hypothetical protein